MELSCAQVAKLPRAKVRFGSRKSTTTDRSRHCGLHQTLAKPVAYCMTVNSHELSDYKKEHPEESIEKPELYINCALYNDERNLFSCASVRGYYEKAQDFAYLSSTSSYYIAYSKDSSPPTIKSLVKHPDINKLMECLSSELKYRKDHEWYKGINYKPSQISTVISGDMVYHPQQSKLVEILSSIKNTIKTKQDRKMEPAELLYSNKVASRDLVETKNLRIIESDLFNAASDCICYSDCTMFQIGQSRACTCNINCLCNYS